MALLTTGKKFIKAVESAGAVGVYIPLEGGFEGRYKRRLRAAGYVTQFLSAPGMGDLTSYLTEVHGVRPPHVGKQDIRTFFLPPIAGYQIEALPSNVKGLALWLYDGQRLSGQELSSLCDLVKQQPKLKIVVELGGDRVFRWQPLSQAIPVASS